MVKDNANPIIYAVQKSSDEDLEDLVGTPSFQHLRFHPDRDGDEAQFRFFSYKTPEERSVHLALQSCAATVAAKASHGRASSKTTFDPLGLLRQAGIDLDTSPSPLLQQPQFNPLFSSTIPTTFTNASKCRDPFTADEVFNIIRNIQDPEHPLTLEQLQVVNRNHITVSEATADVQGQDETIPNFSFVHVQFTPTIPHCSMATLIGLCIRVKLLRSLPIHFKVTVNIRPGTHASEHSINRQLNDKERVRAALENDNLLGLVNKCISQGIYGNHGDS